MARAETIVLRHFRSKEFTSIGSELPTTMTYLTYERALEELMLLDLLDPCTNKLTDIGRLAADYPLQAHLARMLLGCFGSAAGPSKQSQSEILTLVSILSLENIDVFQRLSDERTQELQRLVATMLNTSESDHLTLVNVFVSWWAQPAEERAQWCADHFINEQALIEATKLRGQLYKRLNKDFNLNGELISLADGTYEDLESNYSFWMALVESAGSRWARKTGNNKYIQVGDKEAPIRIIPEGNPAHGTSEKYIVYTECFYEAVPLWVVTALPHSEAMFEAHGVTGRRQKLLT